MSVFFEFVSAVIGRLGAAILAARETILALREHPGTALEEHGSGRMDTRWFGTGWQKAFPRVIGVVVEKR